MSKQGEWFYLPTSEAVPMPGLASAGYRRFTDLLNEFIDQLSDLDPKSLEEYRDYWQKVLIEGAALPEGAAEAIAVPAPMYADWIVASTEVIGDLLDRIMSLRAEFESRCAAYFASNPDEDPNKTIHQVLFGSPDVN